MTSPQDNPTGALQDLLKKAAGSGAQPLWQRYPKRFLAGGAIAVLALALLLSGGKKSQGQFLTETVDSGPLVVTVSASGTLAPTKSVDVGSELSGTLESVLVQENEQVKKGQLLAQLDISKLKDQVVKSQAAVAAAEASVAQAVATVAEARASLSRMRQVAELSGGKVPAKTELETAEATLLRAQANEASARATVTQARATLKSDETNIAKATIRSPVDGVVLTRKVEPGQTVVAAMTTPVLFSLAEDLTQMELQVKVDEADVGSVQVGQQASFTVSAWSGRKFPAQIQRVGIGATTTDNVVTYKTVLKVANNDLALRPGMTATAEIITASRDKALLVPNAALRFTPPQAAGGDQRSLLSRLMPGPPREPEKKRKDNGAAATQVWVLQEGQPVAVAVTPGVSNGRYTEILGGDLQPGMAVITEYQEMRP
ncbi:HlyD family secretion protein [Azospira oryzae]|uniref:HlyD family secretion protein n=1 Tax=Azospira oryzae TaxID=146939 RepID=A0ABY0ISI0_9RHOO|nr:efflux RND transporter periplasmic adaptor subunit [Azospira oryzae]RZT90375.1 HlyD family secretion protein [Azospira oryzae]